MRNVRLSSLVLAVGILFVAASAFPQDCVKVAPKNFKVLLENDQVRVLEYRAMKGEKVATHSHPDHIVYPFTTGKAVFTLADGKSQDLVIEAGKPVFVNATTHSTDHPDDAHVLVIELKKK